MTTGDLLCLLARRLLVQFPHLKLVLMSATMHTELYKTYFDQHTREIQCLSVGARRFPVTIRYLEDVLLESQQSLVHTPSRCILLLHTVTHPINVPYNTPYVLPSNSLHQTPYHHHRHHYHPHSRAVWTH